MVNIIPKLITLFPILVTVFTSPESAVSADCWCNKFLRWQITITGSDQEGLVAEIKSTHSNKCIENKGSSASKGNLIIQSECKDNDNDAQRWVIIQNGLYFSLKNLRTRNCLAVDGGYAYADGAKLVQWDCQPPTDQYSHFWFYYDTGRIINKKSRKCIDVPGGNTSSGLQLGQWMCT